MTTRLTFYHSSLDLIERFHVQLSQVSYLSDGSRGPLDPVPVVFLDADGRRKLRLIRWGVSLQWASGVQSQRLTHIRAESFSDKPSFLPFLRHHRCIIPASAFSVTSGREPYELTAADDAPLALGAIVNAAPAGEGRYELGAALITLPRPASPQAASGRTPLVLPPSGVDAWLDVRPGAPDPESFLKASPEPLVRVPPRVSVFAAA